MKVPLKLPAVTAADETPANQLRIELETRIATQPLQYRSGDEETALGSVHDLFGITRKLLADHPKAKAFDLVATFFLNMVLRPHVSRWHRWLSEERFVDERARRQFRYELKQQLQPQLRRVMELLRALQDPGQQSSAETQFRDLLDQTQDPQRQASLGPHLRAGIGEEVSTRTHQFDGQPGPFVGIPAINQAEWKFIRKRREALSGRVPGELEPEVAVENAAGLCLSGGGIRSATFCLGIVQVLARQNLLSQFDYLSTVSGGGYFGTFLSSYLGTPQGGPRNEDPPFAGREIKEAIDRTFATDGSRESAAVRHLRNNSRYLLNGGLWGRVKVAGLLITGIITNLLLMLPLSLGAALLVGILQKMGFWRPLPNQTLLFSDSPAHLLLGALLYLLVIAWFALPIVRNYARGQPPHSFPSRVRNLWESVALALGVLAAAAAVLVVIPSVLDGYIRIRAGARATLPLFRTWVRSEQLVAVLVTAAPFVFGLLAARLKSGNGKKWMTALFALSGPLFSLIVFLSVSSRLHTDHWSLWGVFIPTAVVFIWGWLAVDINSFSPHGYYRARLCDCYLAAPHKVQSGALAKAKKWLLHGTARPNASSPVGALEQLPLSRMNQTGAAPYHLINTAANLPLSHEPNLRGRDCDFFMFSRDFCGGPVCGYISTADLEKLDPQIDLGTAMAISGAAASSNMGLKTMRNFRFLLTLLNVRLGYWLRNPAVGPRRWFNAPGPFYLFREMTGWMHENSGYVNLSDGGHIENLALYELLRRRCKFIVVVDGGMEPQMECADLMLAQRYAQIDLGIRFDLDIADLALDGQRRSRAYGVFGKIKYEPRDANDPGGLGWLVYLKLACTGGEPGYVVDYRRQFPDFPHQTTGDQIYDEAQFEAYRRLGQCAAESLFRGELAATDLDPEADLTDSPPRFGDIRQWFQALANNLLPDNDPAFEAEECNDPADAASATNPLPRPT